MKKSKDKKQMLVFKKLFKIRKNQIPLILLFSVVSISIMFLFSGSKTSHYEVVAYEISQLAKKSNNKQLTGDFYPVLTQDEKNYSQLSKTINDTKKFNRQNYLYYRDNGHRVRVIANGEGREDYRFKDLPHNPTFILETTFSTAWGQEHIYENYDLYLLNKKSVIPQGAGKFFFITENDAYYLINNKESFKGLTLDDIPGKTLPLTYYDSGIEKSEEWTIANVILSNSMNGTLVDDKLFKSLYTSYIIADFHIPLLDNCFCIAFDFSSKSIDNAKFLNQVVPKYSGYTLRFDARNFKEINQNEVNKIISDFSALKNARANEKTMIILSFSIIFIFAFLLYFYCSRFTVSTTSTSVLVAIVSFVIYSFFFICSKVMPSNFITRAFNTFSILFFVITAAYTVIVVFLADTKSDIKGFKLNSLSKVKNNEK